MKKPSRLDYAYALGRVHALESYLVERAIFSEAAEEEDLSSALKVIYEAGKFPEEFMKVQDSGELDIFLDEEKKKLLCMMAEVLFEKSILEVFRKDDTPREALEAAQTAGYPFMIDYLRHKIDLANIKACFRARYSGAERERLERYLTRGGFLDERIFLKNYDLPSAEMADKIQVTSYRDIWERATDALEENETFIPLERGIEDFLMNYLKKAKQVVFGPEPVYAYGLAKKKELRLVRLLGIGKINQIPVPLLKERISETYV